MPKIPALPSMTSPDGADQLPIEDVSTGTTKYITLTKLKEWFQSLKLWITGGMIANSTLKAVSVSVADWFTSATGYTLRTSTFSTTSASPVDITGGSLSQTITTKGGRLLVIVSLTAQVSTNTSSIYITVDGSATKVYEFSSTSTRAICIPYVVPALAAGSHTIKVQVSIPGGATFTANIYESQAMSLIEF